MPGGWILRLGAFVNTFVSTYCEAEVFSDYSIRLWKSRMGKNTQKSSIWGPLPGRLVKAENVFLSPAQPCPAHHKAWMCTVFWVPRSAQCNWHSPNRASSGTDWDCHEGKPCLSSDLTPLAGLQDLARRTSSCPWQAGGGLSFDFCIRPSARQSLGDKSRKEETWKVPKACPCSSPTHRNSVHPSLPTLEALGGSSPAVAICLCYSLMDFPSHHGVLQGRDNERQVFPLLCFWARTNSSVPGSLHTLHFLVFCTFLASANAVNFDVQLSDWDLFSWRIFAPWKILRFRQSFLFQNRVQNLGFSSGEHFERIQVLFLFAPPY